MGPLALQGAGGLGFAEPGKGHISGLTKKTPGSGTSALRPRPGGRVANRPWAVRGNGQFSRRCLGSRGRLIETPAPQGPLPTLGTAAPEKARRQLCWVPLASHGGRTGTQLGPGTMDLTSRPIPRGPRGARFRRILDRRRFLGAAETAHSAACSWPSAQARGPRGGREGSQGGASQQPSHRIEDEPQHWLHERGEVTGTPASVPRCWPRAWEGFLERGLCDRHMSAGPVSWGLREAGRACGPTPGLAGGCLLHGRGEQGGQRAASAHSPAALWRNLRAHGGRLPAQAPAAGDPVPLLPENPEQTRAEAATCWTLGAVCK